MDSKTWALLAMVVVQIGFGGYGAAMQCDCVHVHPPFPSSSRTVLVQALC